MLPLALVKQIRLKNMFYGYYFKKFQSELNNFNNLFSRAWLKEIKGNLELTHTFMSSEVATCTGFTSKIPDTKPYNLYVSISFLWAETSIF